MKLFLFIEKLFQKVVCFFLSIREHDNRKKRNKDRAVTTLIDGTDRVEAESNMDVLSVSEGITIEQVGEKRELLPIEQEVRTVIENNKHDLQLTELNTIKNTTDPSNPILQPGGPKDGVIADAEVVRLKGDEPDIGADDIDIIEDENQLIQTQISTIAKEIKEPEPQLYDEIVKVKDEKVDKKEYPDKENNLDENMDKSGDEADSKKRKNTNRKKILSPFKPEFILIDSFDEEEPDIDKFIENLERENLEEIFNLRMKKLERRFQKALERYEYIGELPVSEKTYKRLIEYLRINARKNRKIYPHYSLPVLFSISMVFCARYSETEAREFWKPYAQEVWGCEPSQYFQNVCRQLFTYSREYLRDTLNLSFNIHNYGDVVRPVYQHAIIPGYLQDSFAEWLINNFEILQQYPTEQLPFILKNEKTLDYVPLRLRNFIRSEETKETAARLITRMSNAIRLFYETEQIEAVESIMSSIIEESLWESVYRRLNIDPSQIAKLRKITPKLEWLWDLDHDDIVLELSRIRSDQADKPDSVTWAEGDAQYLKGNRIFIIVYPWPSRSGGWEVDPVKIPIEGSLDGNILVLSENFDLDKDKQSQDSHIIFERAVPSLRQPIIYFRVIPQSNFAARKEQIDSDGTWIIASCESIKVIDSSGNQAHAGFLNMPSCLREFGLTKVGKYDIQLPVTLCHGKEVFKFDGRKDQWQIIPTLSGEEKIAGLSTDIPPIFRSPHVFFQFSIDPDIYPLRRIWLLIYRNGQFMQSVLLSDLINQGKMVINEHLCKVNLLSFLAQPGTYSINLLHNIKALLDNPVQFSWLPEEVKIAGPIPDICYSPCNPLQVTINGITSKQVIPIQDEKSKITTDDNTVKIEWKIVRNPKCRFNIQWEDSLIHFCWDIDRVSAWIEGSDKNRVTESQEQDVVLQVRGKPREHFFWIIDGTNEERQIQLNAKGEFNAKLFETQVRDMLLENNRAKSTVSIAIRGYTWELFDYYKKPKVEITQVSYQRPFLKVVFTQEQQLRGTYIIQVRSMTDYSRPEVLKTIETLEDHFSFEIDLGPGKYQVEIILDDTLVSSSAIFQIEEEITPTYETVQIINDYGTPAYLFRVLTATKQEILSRSYDGLPITGAVEQLQLIHTPEEWLSNESWDDGLKRLLPSWAVLKYPLRFITKNHQKTLRVFPEKAVYGGRAGKGYIELKLERERIRVAASWRPGSTLEYSELWMGISQTQDIKFYSELDQDDLWPAYQCRDCGKIVGSRNGSYLQLPPHIVQLHWHTQNRNIREQFIDTVYGQHIEVSVKQYQNEPLLHAYKAMEVVYKNYLQLLIDGKIRPLHGDLEQPIDLYKNSDYGLAISELFEHLQHPTTQNILEYSNKLSQLAQYIEDKSDVPAFGAAQRLMRYVNETAIPLCLPNNILSLTMVLRLKANHPNVYRNLLNDLNLSEDILITLIEYAAQCCPKLHEWSIAWSELFYVHAIS